MDKFFDEPMLNKISYLNDKNSIEFEFYDSSSGDDLGKILCKNIFIFIYNTNNNPDEELLPCLVFDVYGKELIGDEVVLMFRKLNYGYSRGYLPSHDPAVPESDTYYYFKIENGPVDITVVCQRLEQIEVSSQE